MEITLRLWHWPKQCPEPIYTLISTFIKFPFFPSPPLWPQAWKLVLLSNPARSHGRSRGWGSVQSSSSVRETLKHQLKSYSGFKRVLNIRMTQSGLLSQGRCEHPWKPSTKSSNSFDFPGFCHFFSPCLCHTLNIIPRWLFVFNFFLYIYIYRNCT